MQAHQIDLPGLEATNLLGYMAALGVLRTLSGEADVGLSWSQATGVWTAAIHHPDIAEGGQLARRIAALLAAGPPKVWSIANDLAISPTEFREISIQCVESGSWQDRTDCDFLAAFGSDGCATGNKAESIADTEFRTMSGAGHQHFLGFMRELHESTTVENIRGALFEQWTYSDAKPSMRWDPNDYRPHALRAEDPSGDPIKTVRGANRLAIEALPLFPTMPTARRLRTSGFDDDDGVLCPVWEEPLDCDSVRSLLALGDLRKIDKRKRELRWRGVCGIFRAERFTDGKYRNFSPSRQIF